ncbi:MAG: ABC transporter permease [Clostridia bacterium]|nr:ABC transporter permease [Clostridia bacterium]
MVGVLKRKEANILYIIVAISIAISIRNRAFLTWENALDLLKANAVMGMVAMGMLMAILTGGIDVSVGAVTAVVTVMTGRLMLSMNLNLSVVFVLAGVFGALMGFINGFCIAAFNLPPIVVTLGTVSVYNGLNLYCTNGTWITNLPQWFQDFGDITVLGLPIQVVFLAAAALVTWFVLNHTVVGRGIYAMGGNLDAARRTGFNVSRITMFVYSYIGFMAGIAAVVHSSIVKMVDPNAFAGFDLQVIAVVVLGGANALGGEGSVFGTLLGLLMIGIINNGLILAWIPTYWQQVIVGIIILSAVCFDVIRRRNTERSMCKIDIA